jgi:23S rRNA maturation-related 3'-5' exoribonuclease YhaM
LLTSTDHEILDGASLLDFTLIKSKGMKLGDIVHVNGDTNLWRSRRIGVSGQESEEDSVGTIEELLYGVGMDVTSDHVPNE